VRRQGQDLLCKSPPEARKTQVLSSPHLSTNLDNSENNLHTEKALLWTQKTSDLVLTFVKMENVLPMHAALS
jgi:hypothetical protein